MSTPPTPVEYAAGARADGLDAPVLFSPRIFGGVPEPSKYPRSGLSAITRAIDYASTSGLELATIRGAVPDYPEKFGSGAHPAMGNGAFSVLEFSNPEDPHIACLAQFTSGIYLDTLREVGTYRLAYEQLRATALKPQDSAELIVRYSPLFRVRTNATGGVPARLTILSSSG